MKELVAKAPSQERLAADVGVPLATLKRWSSNGKPQNRSMPMLRRFWSHILPWNLALLSNLLMQAWMLVLALMLKVSGNQLLFASASRTNPFIITFSKLCLQR